MGNTRSTKKPPITIAQSISIDTLTVQSHNKFQNSYTSTLESIAANATLNTYTHSKPLTNTPRKKKDTDVYYFGIDKVSRSSITNLLRQATADDFLPKSYELDWTIDHHRMSRTYLVHGIIRKWESTFNFIIPNDIILTVFLFYYLGHRERFENKKDLDPDAQIIHKKSDESEDVKDRKITMEYGSLVIDTLLSITRHVWIFRILDKNCCSIGIGLTDCDEISKDNLTKPMYSLLSDGQCCYHTGNEYKFKLDMNYTWGHIVIMELDLAGDVGVLRYGVQKEAIYSDYENVDMKIAWGDLIKGKKMRMAVWLKGYEAGIQLLEYFEDDGDAITQMKSESYMEF